MTLRLAGSSSGFVEIDSPAVGGNNTLVLPNGNGVSGQVLSTNGSGALSWVDRFSAAGPAFRAFRTTNQSVSNNNWNKYTPNIELFDSNNNFDNATNYRFTPTIAGYYQVNGSISIEGSSATRSRCIAAIYKNGSTYCRGSDSITSETYASVVADLVYLNGSTDYIELFGYIASGSGTVVFTGTASGEIGYFSAFLARPA